MILRVTATVGHLACQRCFLGAVWVQPVLRRADARASGDADSFRAVPSPGRRPPESVARRECPGPGAEGERNELLSAQQGGENILESTDRMRMLCLRPGIQRGIRFGPNAGVPPNPRGRVPTPDVTVSGSGAPGGDEGRAGSWGRKPHRGVMPF